jgi:hypothetical protein
VAHCRIGQQLEVPGIGSVVAVSSVDTTAVDHLLWWRERVVEDYAARTYHYHEHDDRIAQWKEELATVMVDTCTRDSIHI